jgi:hypothetical protein
MPVDLKTEIINDMLTLESFQLDEKVDLIGRLLPLYFPNEILDNELYFKVLLRNLSPASLQHILY